MSNVNDHRKGQRVTILPTAKPNRLLPDFPGWGANNYREFLAPLANKAGTTGTVSSVNSHGSAPFTRYSLRLADGSRATDAVPGRDFDWS